MPGLILTYHSLDTSGSVISTDPAVFSAQMEYLVQKRIPVVPLESIATAGNAVALTFDDGFRNFIEHAFPVLARYRLAATVFVVSGYCGRRNDWPSQPADGIPRIELMDWPELREIARHGISLGAHTATHPRLPELDERTAEQELVRSREEIRGRTGANVATLAYPYGESSAAVRACARSHFRVACGTRLGPVWPASDPADLPRLDVYYFRRRFWFESLWSAHGMAYLLARRGLRALRRSLPVR